MTDTVICEECKKVVSKKHAIRIGLKYHPQEGGFTRCLDCHEEYEDRIQKDAQERHDALVSEWGEDYLMRNMNAARLKSYEDIKEKIKKMRENV